MAFIHQDVRTTVTFCQVVTFGERGSYCRRIYGGDPWIGGGPYMVNEVARRIYGGDPWVGELWCVAVAI